MKKEFKKFMNEKVDNAFIGVDEKIVKRYNAIVNFTKGKKIITVELGCINYELANVYFYMDYDFIYNSTIDKIIPYQPCFHPGNETCNYQCPCKARGFCEKYCACNKQLCKLSWNGCHCKGPCNSSLCPCFVNNRECDYDLCQSIINI